MWLIIKGGVLVDITNGNLIYLLKQQSFHPLAGISRRCKYKYNCISISSPSSAIWLDYCDFCHQII